MIDKDQLIRSLNKRDLEQRDTINTLETDVIVLQGKIYRLEAKNKALRELLKEIAQDCQRMIETVEALEEK